MRRIGLLAILLLAGCGEKDMTGSGGNAPLAMEMAPPANSPSDDELSDAVQPQIAYAYRLAFRLPTESVAAVQIAHIRLCDSLGPKRCRLVAQERRGGDRAGGSVAFEVEAGAARNFADRMDTVVGEAGGSTTTRAVSAEDLSKSIIDNEARIRAKQALADRLLGIIRTRNGKIGELVAAERAFAETQEELDAARSGLDTMRRRVAMSRIDADYTSVGSEGGGGWAIRDAFDSAGLALGSSVAAMIRLVVVAVPWLLLAGLIVAGIRRWRNRDRN